MKRVQNILIGTIACGVLLALASCGSSSSGGGAVVYTVGGTLTGSAGNVVLKLNGGSDIAMNADGSFTFPGLASGATYNVQVVASNRCTVTNGAGTVGAANVTNVAVNCAAQATQVVVRSARLSGAQENPPVATGASGVGGVIVDPTDTDGGGNVLITGGITFSGLTPSAGGHHIHQAPSGMPTQNGGVIVNLILASDGSTAVVPPNTRLTPAQYAALLAGELYFNVHTAANSGGEIRGQLDLQGGVLAGRANLDGAQEAPTPVATAATGKGSLIVDAATRTILISYVTHDVANTSNAHIHAALGPGTSGAPVINFVTRNNDLFGVGSHLAAPSAGDQMSTSDVANLLASYLYFNVHSDPGFPGGEIRGDITPL